VHITVEQLGPALGRLVRLGGQVVRGAERIGGLGSRALVSDPLGVLFYLVELDQPSALRADLPLANDFYWTELACERPARHVGFYRDLLGWTAELTPLGDLELHFLSSGGERVASVVADRDLAGEAGWISYVQVADVEASCARAVELGGSVCRRPVTLPGLGCFAAITDTLGTRLALWKSQS
jgi:predicted enzyme related to lactoylglutathione lyase